MGNKSDIPWFMQHVGDAIAKAQNELGISTAKLAKKTGLSRTTITLTKKGVNSLSLENAYKICIELGMAISDLVPDSGVKSRENMSRKISIEILEAGRPDDYEPGVTDPNIVEFTAQCHVDDFRQLGGLYHPIELIVCEPQGPAGRGE